MGNRAPETKDQMQSLKVQNQIELVAILLRQTNHWNNFNNLKEIEVLIIRKKIKDIY